MNNDSTKVIATLNLELDFEQESDLVVALDEAYQNARREQGYRDGFTDHREKPAPKSWMWYRVAAMNAYKHDYSWRLSLPDESIWKKSNRSLQVYETQARDHYVQISRSILRNHRFFTMGSEGKEDYDQHESNPGQINAVSLVQRRLQWRSKKTGLRTKLDDAVLKALLCGECIIKPSLRSGVRPTVEHSHYLLESEGGSPLRDSNGNHIKDSADWIQNEDGTISLVNDPDKKFPGNSVFPKSKKPKKFYTAEVFKDGSNFDIIDHRDFVCDPRFATVNDADYKGYEFSWTFDRLREYLSQWDVNKVKLKQYEDLVKEHGSTTTSAALHARAENGEDESEVAPPRNTGTRRRQGFIRLIEEYISIDALGLGFCQDIVAIRDLETKDIIAYTFAKDTMSWREKSDKSNHPFKVLKSSRVADRWYGCGYFEDMYDDLMIVDEIQNAIRLEILHGGNVKFIWPRKIKNVKDGGPLMIRGDVPNELENGVMDAKEAFDVVQIIPQVAELNGQLEFEMGRIRAKYGQMNPGSSSAGMEGADTLGGMQIIQDQSNAYVGSRISVLSEGLDECLKEFTRIELLNNDHADTIEQMDRERANIIKQFIEQNSDNFAEAMETMLANSNNMTAINTNLKALEILGQWAAWPEERKEIDRPLFVKILLGLDVSDPESHLRSVQPMLPAAGAVGPQPTGGAPPAIPGAEVPAPPAPIGAELA